MMMHKDGRGDILLWKCMSMPCVSQLLYTQELILFLEFSNSASLYSGGRFAVPTCVCMVVKLESEIHKLILKIDC